MTNTALFFSLFTKINETIHTFTNNTPLIFWFDGGPVKIFYKLLI